MHDHDHEDHHHDHGDHHHHEHDGDHHHHEHEGDVHGNPEGHGSLKPEKIDFVDFKMERAFAFDASKGEKGIITYTISEPARISIKVLKAGTRELFLNIPLNWEVREAGTHTETWDGRDFDGNIIDLEDAAMIIEGEPLSTYAPGKYSVDGMSPEEIVHGHAHGHAHNEYDASTNVIPELTVTSIREGDVLSGLVTIESHLDGGKAYGDKAGYGVRYYLGNNLLQEEFYDRKCDGKFSYIFDTTAVPDGEHMLYVGMCDHHQHVTSRGYKIKIDNSQT